VVCVSCWDQTDQKSYSFRKNTGVDLDALLKMEADDVAAEAFARASQQQCGGVVGFRLIDPFARGGLHGG
jgi:hypothetical protein